MRVEDYTTASATILISEEAVLDDIKLACIVTCRLSFHDGSVFVLTLLLEALHKTHFILTDLNLEVVFQQLDHSLSTNKHS